MINLSSVASVLALMLTASFFLTYAILFIIIIAIKVHDKRKLSVDNEEDKIRLILFFWWPVFFLISFLEKEMGPIWLLGLYQEAFSPNYESS